MTPFKVCLNLETDIKPIVQKSTPRVFEVTLNVEMQTIRSLLSSILPKVWLLYFYMVFKVFLESYIDN